MLTKNSNDDMILSVIYMKKQKFNISGMTCSACSAHVENAVKKLDGIDNVCVNLLANTMETTYDESKLNNKKIINAVQSAGYGAKEFSRENEEYNGEADKAKRRLILSVLFLIPLMFVSMSHMFGLHIAILNNMTVLGIAEIVLLIPILILNKRYFISGFRSLFRLSPNMDSLIALGAGISILYSIYNLIIASVNGNDVMTASEAGIHYYFESAGMILTFISVGKYLESKSKSKTSSAISKLVKLTPKTALVEKDGVETEIETSEVVKNDIVICKNGNNIPVDGEIVFGNCSVDESAITGESIPVDKTVGDMVTGGTIITSGYIKIKAINTGDDTTLSKIIKLVEDATTTKAPIARIADKVAAVFVPAVMTIAALTTVIWLLCGAEVGQAISFGIAVLVISCPCALGLATPTAIMVGTGKAAQYGILIKSAEALEISNSLKTIIMDKTGTITQGSPTVTDVIPFIDKKTFLETAYSLENSSEHPLAKAITEYAVNNNVELKQTKSFQSYTGSGISAEINGKVYYSGNVGFIEDKVGGFDYNSISELTAEGKTPLIFADSEKVLGIIAVADKIKETSAQAVSALNGMGIEAVMLTGDNKNTANTIQKKVGIKTAYAQVLPQQKEHVVRKYKKLSRTAMVGDGINDSPALVSADVGIAIGAGTDIAIDSADIVLMKNDLMDVVTTVQLSKAVMKNIKENLFWAFIYNIICIPLAAGAFYYLLGWAMKPMFGTIAMSLSSICVVSNALRLKRFKPYAINNNKKLITEYKTIVTEDFDIETKTVLIEGMMCEHCVARVKKALESVSDEHVTVNLNKNSAEVSKDVPDKSIKKAVEDAGYKVVSIE